MSEPNSTEDHGPVADAAERIVEAGDSVREKTRNLVVDTMETAKLGLGQIGGDARDVCVRAVSRLRAR